MSIIHLALQARMKTFPYHQMILRQCHLKMETDAAKSIRALMMSLAQSQTQMM